MDDEGNFYAFTIASEAALIRRVAARVYELCCTPGKDFSVFERARGLYCTGQIAVGGYRVLKFWQVPGFTEADAYARCFEEPTAPQRLARLEALHAVSKQVTVHVALGCIPPELNSWQPELGIQDWRRLESWRMNPEKPYRLPWSDEEWHPKVRAQYTKRGAPWWRTICIAPDKQTPGDVCFQLGLILLQEQMIPEAEVKKFTDIMEECLREQPWGYADKGTARLVLEWLQRHFTEPEDWRALRNYVSLYLYREGRKEKRRVFHEWRRDEREHANLIAVQDALAQFVAEGLPATRSTLFRWAKDWGITTPSLAVYDGDGGLWLTSAGIAEARQRLQWKYITKYQIEAQHKNTDTARKRTYRYRMRRKTPAEAARALLSPRKPRIERE
jgi:hypothetical protein